MPGDARKVTVASPEGREGGLTNYILSLVRFVYVRSLVRFIREEIVCKSVATGGQLFGLSIVDLVHLLLFSTGGV